MINPVAPRTADLVCKVERQALVEMFKANYLMYRTTRLNVLFDHLKEISSYRENKYSKFTPQKELKAALVTVFFDQGEPLVEADNTASIHLQQANDDETQMEELVATLNRQTKKQGLGEVDQVMELNIYALKSATMQRNPEPNFEALFQEIELHAKQPSENLHKLWMSHAENSQEGMQYESEEAFRLDQAFTAARYRMMCLQENFRTWCQKYIECEIYQQEKSQSFSLFQKKVERITTPASQQNPLPLGVRIRDPDMKWR